MKEWKMDNIWKHDAGKVSPMHVNMIWWQNKDASGLEITKRELYPFSFFMFVCCQIKLFLFIKVCWIKEYITFRL